MDLIRKILFEIEKNTEPDQWFEISISGYEKDDVYYHVMLLKEAGLIDAKKVFDGGPLFPIRLTWNGHEFLEAAKNDTVWSKTKDIILKKGGGFSFEIIKNLLIETLKKNVMG